MTGCRCIGGGLGVQACWTIYCWLVCCRQGIYGWLVCCHGSWLRNTVPIHSMTTVLICCIQTLIDTFLLYFIFSIETTVWTHLTVMQRLLGKVIALHARSTAISIRGTCAVSSHYLIYNTTLTIMTRGRVQFIWECCRRTGPTSDVFGWECNLFATYWI